MDGQSKNLPPLPAWLGDPMDEPGARLGKRDRTRRQLIAAAVKVLATRGVAGATVQEIASVAEMTPGTVYNHFDTKDDVIQAVALWIAETLCRRIAESYGLCARAPSGWRSATGATFGSRPRVRSGPCWCSTSAWRRRISWRGSVPTRLPTCGSVCARRASAS